MTHHPNKYDFILSSPQPNMPALPSAMDLGAEAIGFGGFAWQTEDDIPTAAGRQSAAGVNLESLAATEPGDARTGVHVEAVRSLMAAARCRRNSAPFPDRDLPPDTPMANQANFIDAAHA
jgi:hypothetical protein